MKVSIAIPTYNRARELSETLAALARLEPVPGFDLECLVVDNNSGDETAAVVAAFAREAPFPTRRLAESRLGSSAARNRAIGEAAGEILLFIDDDVSVEPTWATELLAEMERRTLDAACGMVLPRWQAPPPPWLSVELYGKLAVHNQAALLAPAGGRSVERLSNFFSANAGFRREVFQRFGSFREDLGIVGGNPLAGEDTDLFERIMRGGGRVGFAPRAVVHHRIGRQRLTRAYFRRKSFAYGVGSARRGARSHNQPGKLLKNLLRMAGAALRGDRGRIFRHQLECLNFCGYWFGRLAKRGAPRPAPLG